jgi:hypothetical protein
VGIPTIAADSERYGGTRGQAITGSGGSLRIDVAELN